MSPTFLPPTTIPELATELEEDDDNSEVEVEDVSEVEEERVGEVEIDENLPGLEESLGLEVDEGIPELEESLGPEINEGEPELEESLGSEGEDEGDVTLLSLASEGENESAYEDAQSSVDAETQSSVDLNESFHSTLNDSLDLIDDESTSWCARRSTRERRAPQKFTYDEPGEPSQVSSGLTSLRNPIEFYRKKKVRRKKK